MNIRSLLVGLVIGVAIATAATAAAVSGRRYLNAAGKVPALPFSDGVLVGNTLYLAGKLPARAFLGSGKLLREARFEIMGIAVRR